MLRLRAFPGSKTASLRANPRAIDHSHVSPGIERVETGFQEHAIRMVACLDRESDMSSRPRNNFVRIRARETKNPIDSSPRRDRFGEVCCKLAITDIQCGPDHSAKRRPIELRRQRRLWHETFGRNFGGRWPRGGRNSGGNGCLGMKPSGLLSRCMSIHDSKPGAFHKCGPPGRLSVRGCCEAGRPSGPFRHPVGGVVRRKQNAI